MLGIRQVKHLVRALDISFDKLSKVIESPESYYEELLLIDPAKPNKRRIVVNVLGMMRAFQMRLYKGVLLPKLSPCISSHGGVPGCSIKTNVQPHIKSAYVFKTDISDFYPSVHFKRIYRLFTEQFECSPDVARICTKICTYKHHLALGLITSPILADQILSLVDRRIAGACAKAGLTYTRFVDDIAISGPFDLQKSNFAGLVGTILSEHGFKTNPAKNQFGKLDDDFTITSLRVVNGQLDVRSEYIDELIRQIDDAGQLAQDGTFQGPYYTRGQIVGRVRFVCWINPGRRRELLLRFRSVRWDSVSTHALQRGLVSSRKSLVKITPDRTAQQAPDS